MELFMIAGIIIFILIVIILVIMLLNQVKELQQVSIPKKKIKRQYILEVNEVGEIKIREKNPSGGINYQQFNPG